MFVMKCVVLTAVFLACSAQGPTTTPVPILKQINKQNDDGSYSYGYEAADGSFKIETKYPNGDVAGKYGYIDEDGKAREISYGAGSQRGFEPQGAGIMVPPPTLHDPTSSNALTEGQEDDGQYREDPKIYEDPKYHSRAQGRQQASTFKQFHQPAQQAPEPQRHTQPQYNRYTRPENNKYTQTAQRFSSQFEAAPQYQPTQSSQFRSGPLFSQETNLFSQTPQQFPQENRPQSQVYHSQPQFSYQAFQPQPQYQAQQNYQQQYQPQYQPQNYQSQNYQSQNYNPYLGHPAQNFDPNTGSYSINYTG